MTTILTNNINAKVMIDTGASVNVMDEATYAKIRKPTLVRHRGPRIMPYGGGTSLNVLGLCDVTIESKSVIQCHRFHVVKGAHGSLVGFTAAQELGLVNIDNNLRSALIGRIHTRPHKGYWQVEGCTGQITHR